MQSIGSNPQVTHDDMALIPAQGRDPHAVQEDVAAARAAEKDRRDDPAYGGPKWVYGADGDSGSNCNYDAKDDGCDCGGGKA